MVFYKFFDKKRHPSYVEKYYSFEKFIKKKTGWTFSFHGEIIQSHCSKKHFAGKTFRDATKTFLIWKTLKKKVEF